MKIVVSYQSLFLVKTNFAIFMKTHPCKLLRKVFAVLSISGYKNRSDLSFPPDIAVSYVVFEIYYVYIISL